MFLFAGESSSAGHISSVSAHPFSSAGTNTNTQSHPFNAAYQRKNVLHYMCTKLQMLKTVLSLLPLREVAETNGKRRRESRNVLPASTHCPHTSNRNVRSRYERPVTNELPESSTAQAENVQCIHDDLPQSTYTRTEGRTARDKCRDIDVPNFKIKLYNTGEICSYELPTSQTLGGIVFESGRTSRHFNSRFCLYWSTGVLPKTEVETSGWKRKRKEFAVYCAIEQSRMDFMRKHQSDIRIEYLSGLYDAISRGDREGITVSKKIILPRSFTCGPQYMYSHYLDALAICLLYTTEFQKRGLPHCHTLLWVDSKDKIENAKEVDQYVSAELPDPGTDPTGYKITVNNQLLPTYRSACEALGLLGDDKEWDIALEESSISVTFRTKTSFHLLFVYGHGGTGKTFLWKTIISSLRFEGKIVLAVTSSGIALLLLPAGRTGHSRFKLPLELTDESLCHVTKNTQLGKLLAKTDLIIWDEAPMNDRRCFEALDRTLRDLMNEPETLFEGKTVVLGGDF
ncbi:DNA helicase [Tanacetum coccineum]